MKDYILDTNIAGHYAEYKLGIINKNTIAIDSHLRKIDPNRKVSFCVITVGEMEYGLKVAQTIDGQDDIRKLCDFILLNNVFSIDISVAKECYSSLRSKLFEKYFPKDSKKSHRMNQLRDPVSEEILGIQENDLWIASIAMNYGLILVTNDKLSRIKEVAGTDIEIENWLNPIV